MNVTVRRHSPALVLRTLLCAALIMFSAAGIAQAPPSTAAWNKLLHANVHVIDHGTASQVDYAGMRKDHAQLDAYTHQLIAVTAAQFHSWNKNQQKAFLINAYNAFTVQLILTRWPKLSSIKDLGGLFSSPWKKDFFSLLGHKTHLDAIESRLRSKTYADPRVHFALNCASIGCPMLRPEAYTADKLDAQLDDQARRFLSDHSRNRYAKGKLEVSKIFDWYAGDFSHGWHGITSVKQFLAAHAPDLTADKVAQTRIRAQKVSVDYLDYNWHLNGLAKP